MFRLYQAASILRNVRCMHMVAVLPMLGAALALASLSVLALQDDGDSEAGETERYVNSFGVTLPPDAAPPELQVLTQFSPDNRYLDRGTSTYKQAWGVGLVAEPLVRVDRDFNLLPAGATSWELSKDGLTWTYQIRKGMIFADGHPLTARDYEATFRRWANPETGFDFEWYFRSIKNWTDVVGRRLPLDSLGVKALDEHTVAFTTESPTPYLPLLLAKSWVSPTHLFDKYGPEWATRPETHFGSGPYRLVEWIKGDRIVLGINQNYRGPTRPMLERVVSRLYNLAVPPQFLSAYEAGEVDYVPLTNQAEINRIKADRVLRDQLNAYTDFSTYYLMLDTYNPPFDDVRVRKAFAHAIDVDAIIKSAMRDVGIPASSMLPPGFPGSNTEELAPLQKFDPDLARRYLAEAGYPGGRGFPEVNLWLRGEAANIRTAAEAVQAMLNQHLALDVGVRNVERKVYLDAMSNRELTLGMVPYQYDFIDAGNLLTIWLSNGRHAWHNDRFERLVRQANELVGDPEGRMAMYRDAERILVDEAGGIFLWYIRINQMWKPFVRGVSLEPNQWGYRAWRGELMSNLQTNLYITRDVFEDPTKKKPEPFRFWQWLTGEG